MLPKMAAVQAGESLVYTEDRLRMEQDRTTNTATTDGHKQDDRMRRQEDRVGAVDTMVAELAETVGNEICAQLLGVELPLAREYQLFR